MIHLACTTDGKPTAKVESTIKADGYTEYRVVLYENGWTVANLGYDKLQDALEHANNWADKH